MFHNPKLHDPHVNYFPYIDGLRAIAVLSVVFHHLLPNLVPGGFVGVDIFFVISGYLITRIITREINENSFTFIGFYERRVRRIFPALFSVLIFTLIVGYFLFLPSDFEATLRGVFGALFFVSNIIFWRDLQEGYFAAMDTALNPVVHTWSLAVEEQFYIFFPILLLLLHKIKFVKITFFLFFLFIISLIGSELFLNEKRVAVFFLTPFRAWELLVGVLLAFNIFPKLYNRFFAELFIGLGIVAILFSCFFYSPSTLFPGLSALLPTLGSAAIIYAGQNGYSFTRSILEFRPLVYIGLISYSLYLWHWPVIVIAGLIISNSFTIIDATFLLFISIGLASLSYHFIEQPFRGKKGIEKFSRPMVFKSSLVVVFGLSLFSLAGILTNGYEHRFSDEIINFDRARLPDFSHKNCDNRSDPETWCTIGKEESSTQTIIFGDSHLLSWSPALDKIFKKRGESAILAVLSNCPPVFGVKSWDSKHRSNKECLNKSFEVEKLIKNNGNIKNVVIVAIWRTYFLQDSSLEVTVEDGKEYAGGLAAYEGLKNTLNKINQYNKNIIVIGPVPTYEKSVPFLHAKALNRNIKFPTSDLIDQQKRNGKFYDLIDSFLSTNNFNFIDPLEWMCNKECITTKNGKSLYHDSNHLNKFGALSFENTLNEKLELSLFKK